MARASGKSSLLDVPMYPPPMAGRLAKLSSARVRRWLQGYGFHYKDRHGEQRAGHSPAIVPGRRLPESIYASFLDLVDLLFVKAFLDKGFSLQKLRKAFQEVRTVLGETHFARRNFFTHGKAIYLQLVEVGEEEAPSMLELLADGQWAIPGMIERIGEQIDFSPSDHLAERWFPPGYGRMIALDPKIAFGRPVLYQRGVPTAAIHDLYLGEGEVTGAVCEWMELKPREVEKAVAFERELAA